MDNNRKDQISTTMAKNSSSKDMTKATICPEFADILFFLAKIHP